MIREQRGAVRKAHKKAEKTARKAERGARDTAANPWFRFAQRAGYVARGVLYAAMGVLALGLAFRIGGEYTDQRGSLVLISAGPFGRVILAIFVAAIGAYSCWGFIRAFLDPFRQGDDPEGLANRAGFLWSGLAYASLTVFAAELLAGRGTSNQDQVQATMVKLLGAPFGRWIVVVIGVIAVGAGLAQFVEAYRAGFTEYMKKSEMSRVERRIAEWLGRAGYFSRGTVFTLVGWFILEAGLRADAAEAHGFGGAFAFLAGAPFGRVLLAIVALGFVALGLHSFACARWIRLLGSGR
jgi:hypothetical protein